MRGPGTMMSPTVRSAMRITPSSMESASGLIALRIRMVYEAGRDDAVKLFLERAQLLEYIKGLGDSRAKLMDFAHYMEALVAYHRFILHMKEG